MAAELVEMIHIVTAENRALYESMLMEMHEHRREVFVDRLKWPLTVDGGLEIDAFDTMACVYLLRVEEGRIAASTRLMPTDRPHLLGNVFADLCDDEIPQGAHIWEASRFCPAPQIEGRERRRGLLGELIIGAMETCVLHGVEGLTFVASAALAPLAADAGWRVRQLGPAQSEGAESIVAMMAEIDLDGLRRARFRHGVNRPLVRFAPNTAQNAG